VSVSWDQKAGKFVAERSPVTFSCAPVGIERELEVVGKGKQK